MITYDFLINNKRIANIMIQTGIISSRYSMLLDVYRAYLDHRDLGNKKSESVNWCAKAFKVSRQTVYNIINEMETETWI